MHSFSQHLSILDGFISIWVESRRDGPPFRPLSLLWGRADHRYGQGAGDGDMRQY
jgi:hypothetical protein